jgi:hypothetical protein
MKRKKGDRKDINPSTSARNSKSAADNAHEKETADENAVLPRADPDLSGGEGPARTLAQEHTAQEQEPEVDRDFGVSGDFNDEQANDDNLPTIIDAGNARLPASYERAKRALAECESIDECKDWANKAKALAAYGRMQGDTELEKLALRIRAHAARRAGELLHEIPAETGGRPPRKKYSGGHSPEFSDASREVAEKPMSPRAAAAKDAGMSEHQAKEAMRVATVPKEEFDRQVTGSKPPSVATLAKQGTRNRTLPSAPAAGTHRAIIGTEAVTRALETWRADIPPAQQNEIDVDTRQRQAFASAIGHLPLSDAGWACKMAFYVEQEVREAEET